MQKQHWFYGGVVLLAATIAAVAGPVAYNQTLRDTPPAPAAEPALIIVIDDQGTRTDKPDIEALAAKIPLGTWTVQAIPKAGDRGWTRTIYVTDGVRPPVPPVPIPVPVPVPPQPPTPVPPIPTPVPPLPQPGPRAVLIIRESASTTPDVARMITGLRAGPEAAYMKQQGHTLSILDQDDVDENGQPSKLVTAWKPLIAGMTLPVVFVIDAKTNTLIQKESLPPTATAANVVDIVKRNGG